MLYLSCDEFNDSTQNNYFVQFFFHSSQQQVLLLKSTKKTIFMIYKHFSRKNNVYFVILFFNYTTALHAIYIYIFYMYVVDKERIKIEAIISMVILIEALNDVNRMYSSTAT